MTTATHLIKIKGTFDDNKWTEERLKNYVNNKIKSEINSFYHSDLELFQIKDTSIEVWVYIHDLMLSELLDKNIKDWLKKCIVEEGLTVDSFEIEKSGNGFCVIL